jgi:hypothetical protein
MVRATDVEFSSVVVMKHHCLGAAYQHIMFGAQLVGTELQYISTHQGYM